MFRRAVCVAVRDRFPAPVVHVVWWHHFEQGVEPLFRVAGVLFVVGTQVATLSVGLFFHLIQVMHAVMCAHQIRLMWHPCRVRVCCHSEEVVWSQRSFLLGRI